MEASTVTVRYQPEVLEQLRFSALEAFHALPHGGLEIGGLLYGRRTEDGIQILAARQLACEHLFGPAFSLSENDQARFDELLRAPQRDRLLKGLQTVGWYRSASRSPSALTSEDLALHARLFPNGGGLVLILRPERARPVRAQFYHLDESGAWQSNGEFDLLPAPKPRHPAVSSPPETPSAPPAEPAPQAQAPPEHEPAPSPAAERPQTVAAAAPAAEERESPSPQPEFFYRPPFQAENAPHASRPRWFWLILAWLVALASAGYAFRDLWLPEPSAPLQVGLYDLDGQLTIGWGRSAEPLRGAESGILEILDGGNKVSLSLTPELLQKGTAVYSRQTGDVFVRLQAKLPSGKALEGVARFTGPPPPAASAEAEQAGESQTDELRATVEKQAARIRDLENANAVLRKKLANGKR
ncbi:MAG: hypothetical protein K6T61_15105 [Bryobacteraceae bacterium]|nr:hypothetical protein [Bryobacteraceae bacterium]